MNIEVDINCCRSCLQSTDEISLFDNLQLREKFQCITSLKVDDNDGLPIYFCASCAARLEISYEFRLQSIKSYNVFKNHFENLKNKFKPFENEKQQNDMPSLMEDNQTISEHSSDNNFSNSKFEDKVKTDEAHEMDEEINSKIENNEENQVAVRNTNHSNAKLKTTLKNQNKYNQQGKKNLKTRSEFFCDQCDKKFSHSQNLNRHKLIHIGLRPFKCEICLKTFTQNSTLKKHFLTHTGEKPFKCTICNKSFTQGKSLKLHLGLHTGDKPFRCIKCPAQFFKEENLQIHMETKHLSEEKKSYYCTLCNTNFQSKYTLHYHQKKFHKDEMTLFPCNICDEELTSEYILQTHLRQHADHKPYQCEHCGVGFTRNKNYKYHQKLHKINSFACKICSKKFDTPMEVKSHMKFHKKLFKCGRCETIFIKKSELLRHFKDHNEEIEIFNCKHCISEFHSERDLTTHITNMHSDASLVMILNTCTICNISFLALEDYNNHVRSVHNKNINEKSEKSLENKFTIEYENNEILEECENENSSEYEEESESTFKTQFADFGDENEDVIFENIEEELHDLGTDYLMEEYES